MDSERHVVDALAHVDDPAGELVTEHDARHVHRSAASVCAHVGVQIGTADAVPRHLEQDLAGTGDGLGHLLDAKVAGSVPTPRRASASSPRAARPSPLGAATGGPEMRPSPSTVGHDRPAPPRATTAKTFAAGVAGVKRQLEQFPLSLLDRGTSLRCRRRT